MSQSAMSAKVRQELEWQAVLAVAPFLAPNCVQPLQGPAIVGAAPEVRINFDVTLLSALTTAAAVKLVDAFLARHPDFRLAST